MADNCESSNYLKRVCSSAGGGGGGGTSFSCSDLNSCTNVIFPGDVSINNLTVTGTQYIEHQKDLYVGDPLIALNSGVAGANTFDIGWIGWRGTSINAGTIWDESADQFAHVLTTDDGSEAPGNVTIDSYADLKISNLTATGHMLNGVSAPTATGDAGAAGQVAYDSNYCYVCVATDSWKRTALATWT